MKLSLKIAKWLLITTTGLLALLFLYINYVALVFDTKTLPENHGQVQTKLFLSSEDRQPLIVGLGGSDGGNGWAGPEGEKQRALLEKNGYAFLSVAYFGAEGTPEYLDRISIDGVHKAVVAASQHPQINANCIAVMGVSRGGELALLLGSYYKEYKSVIGIVPGSAVFTSLTEAMITPGFSHNEKPLPFVPVPWSAAPAMLSGDLRGAFEKMIENTDAMEKAAIKVENISGPLLLISGTKDEQWPSMEMSNAMMKRLENRAFPYFTQHIPLEGGHNEHHDEFGKVIQFLDEHLRTQPGCTR